MPIEHDRLFKELLTTFFQEFMELFFPEAHALIDYTDFIKYSLIKYPGAST